MPREWVVCVGGEGHLWEQGSTPEKRLRNFGENAVGQLIQPWDEHDHELVVWLIGRNETWVVPASSALRLNVFETGDAYSHKICNRCHRLLPLEQFQVNQRNRRHLVRRPSCNKCRTDIDKRAPKSRQAKQMEKNKPPDSAPFKCPICQKRSIVGITARIVADHDHHTGDIRDFICDSCNTGLGRFKNGIDCLQDALNYLRERDTLNQ